MGFRWAHGFLLFRVFAAFVFRGRFGADLVANDDGFHGLVPFWLRGTCQDAALV